MLNFLRKREAERVAEEEKPEIEGKIGKVFIATSQGKLFGFSPLGEKKKFAKSSKQLAEERKWQDTEGLVARTHEPSSLLRLVSRQPTLASCISVIAEDVSSTGYKLIAKSEGEVETKEGKKALEEERRLLHGFLQHPNPDDSIKEIISSFVSDLNTYGYAGLECVRTISGKELVEIYPVKASSIWVHRSKEKYCQRMEIDRKAWFKRFGLEKDFSVETGKEGKGFTDEEKANELIFKKRYGESDFYASPPWLSAIGAVMTLIAIEEFNLCHFLNFGIPSYVVMLEGEWDEGASKKITSFLTTECKGPQNAGKTMVLQLPPDGKATFEPVGVGKDKEASYRLYISNLQFHVTGTMHVPGYKVGILEAGKLAGNLGEAALRNYINSTVEPQQSLVEDIFNNKVLPAVLGNKEPSFRFELEDVDMGDLAQKVDMWVKLFGCGAFTPNQLIEKLGLGASYPEGDRYFVSSNYVEIGGVELEKADREFFKGLRELDEFKNEIKNQLGGAT